MSQLISSQPRFYTVKLVSKFLSGNLALQVLGLITGIAIVRGLSVQEYAEYSVYVGLLFALISVSDSGMSGTLLSLGAKVAHSNVNLGRLMKAGLRARRKLGAIVTIFGSALLCIMLSANGASSFTVVTAVILLAGTLQAVFTRGVWQVHFRIHFRAIAAQKILVIGALLRLVLVLPTWHWSELGVVYILVATALSYWAEALLMHRLALKDLPRYSGRVRAYEKELGLSIRKVLPMNLTNLARGQLFIGLITFLGAASVIAEVNALSRYALAFSIVNAVVLELVAPKIARHQKSVYTVLKWMGTAMLIYAAIAIAGIVLLQLSSPWLLGLLGDPYKELVREFFIINIGAALINMAMALGVLNQSQNWISGSWTLMPFTLIWLVCGIFVFNLRIAEDAAWLYLLQAVPLWGTEVVRLCLGFRAGIRNG